MRLSAVIVASLLAAPVHAQQGGFEFSIENIMRGPEVVGREPTEVRWTPNGEYIYFRWLEPGTDWREKLDPFRVRANRGAKPERVTDAHMDSIGPLLQEGSDSPDGMLRATAYEGDLYLVDLRRGVARRLTQTVAEESDPRFSADGKHVFFARDGNAFALTLAGGPVRQLTDIRADTAPNDTADAKGQRAVLEEQQRALFEAIRDRLRSDSIAEDEKTAREAEFPKTLYLGTEERVDSLRVSPNGRAALLVTEIPAPEDKARETQIPEYVTVSGYTEDTVVRTKVGDVQNGARVAFMRVPSREPRWLQVVPGDTAHPAAEIELIGWNDAGTAALVSAVSHDYKTRYIHRVDGASGALRTLDRLRDTAWVNGPCFDCMGWYDAGKRVWYVSEADGYAHLYTVSADGRDRRQLTRGEWEVLDVELSPDERFFYLHTSEESPFERHFFRMPVTGGAREQITRRRGGHTVIASPDARRLANVYSAANRPPELHVMANRPGAEMAQLTTSATSEWLSFPWIVPDIVMIPASDGDNVPARIYRPEDMGARRNGAGAIFVHGAGYLHNVHNYWSSYFREYMFNHFLASRGYVVLDIDYRGSAGYGRDWRTAIYRHMGGRDLQDHVDGARYLQKTFGIDPNRIGIYGGSYGGFITLMALFTEPEWFGAGAALRSVTDWAHYNHPYTSRILNFPDQDSVAFRRSSPIYFAEGLEDPLLIAHGMVDVNVHFQDVVRLSQRLIELRKTDWELAVYPVEDHAFVRPTSWSDEYRRIFELFEEHLRAGGQVDTKADAQSGRHTREP